MAASGMAFISVPAVPLPTEVLTCSSALLWRRLPLTSTNVWSGPRPRRVAGRKASVPSLMLELEKLNEGDSICNARPVSCTPERRRRSPADALDGDRRFQGVSALRASPHDNQILAQGGELKHESDLALRLLHGCFLGLETRS